MVYSRICTLLPDVFFDRVWDFFLETPEIIFSNKARFSQFDFEGSEIIHGFAFAIDLSHDQ